MDTDDIWNSLFGGSFESAIKRMEKMFSDPENMGENVRTYGYTAYMDSDGNRHVSEFGNLAEDHRTSCGMVGEPLADVSFEGEAVRAVVEIPGVSKEDIVLEGTKNTLSVSVDTEHKTFAKVLALPCDVDPGSAKAEYNNGILEVTLTPITPIDPKKRINVG